MHDAGAERARAKKNAAQKKWRADNPEKGWAVIAAHDAKKRATKAGITFSINSAYVLSILPTHCPVFGTPFSYIGNGKAGPDSPTLDRLRPNEGYVEGNIVVVSNRANSIKSAYGYDEVARVAEWLKEMGL